MTEGADIARVVSGNWTDVQRRRGLGRSMSYRMTEKIIEVPLSQLTESEDNPRRLYGDLKDFADTLEKQGMLQPLVVRQRDEGGYWIVIGHRRYRAAKMKGWKKVNAIVRPYTQQEALEAMIVENSEREDVNPMELAAGYQRLIDEHHLTKEQVAERLSIGKSTVYAMTSLLKLPEQVQSAVLQGRLPVNGARAIAGIEGERLQLAALSDAMKLAKKGDPAPERAVVRLVQNKYRATAKRGLSKHQREAQTHGVDAAVRRRTAIRLLMRVGELVERKSHIDDTMLRLMAASEAETGNDVVREVFQRHGVHPGRLGKVTGAQLRKLVVELVLAPFVTVDGGEYSTGAKVVAKAIGESLSAMEKTTSEVEAAESLFKKKDS